MNPSFDPRAVGPVTAAGNLYWAAMCIPLSASIWTVGMGVRVGRAAAGWWERERA